MRILVNDFAGHAFPAQLSRELARRRHDVLHVHCSSVTSGKGALLRRPDDPATISFNALDLGQPFVRHSVRQRFRQEMQYGHLLVDRARRYDPDVVISANTPLFAQRQMLHWARTASRGFVYWQQDVISVAMGGELRTRVPIAGSLGARYLEHVERQMLLQADSVITISPDFGPTLERWGVDGDRIHIIENWAPLEEIPPAPRRNAWAETHGLVEPFVFLYAGTLGLKHNPELLVKLAAAVGPLGALLIVVSEGAGAALVGRRANELGLGNVQVLPFEPYDRLPEILATGDVLLAILEPQAGIFSVPSKILSYFCAARPILAAIPRENLAARTIEGAAAGIVVDPLDHAAFVSAGISLLNDAASRTAAAHHARAYAERTFDVGTIGDRVERVLAAATVGHAKSQ